MKPKTKHFLALALGAVALTAVAAGASALITREVVVTEEPVVQQKVTKKENIHWNTATPQQPQPQPQRVASNCDDGNVVGYGLGAVAGGLIGNQIGDGRGKDVATIGGAAAGALAGGQYIPTRGILCPK